MLSPSLLRSRPQEAAPGRPAGGVGGDLVSPVSTVGGSVGILVARPRVCLGISERQPHAAGPGWLSTVTSHALAGRSRVSGGAGQVHAAPGPSKDPAAFLHETDHADCLRAWSRLGERGVGLATC